MIISCPKCSKKFTLDDSKAGSQMKYKCTGCGTVFVAGEQKAKPAAAPAKHTVLLASDNEELISSMTSVLGDERISLSTASDGNAALDMVSKERPELLILDAAIKGLFSFTVCEIIKNNPSLARTKIILAAAVYNKKRYKREPAALFGADVHIETHAIESELAQKAGALLGIELSGKARAAEKPKVAEESGLKNELTVKASGSSAESDKARKLARVIAADIFLYNHKKLEGVTDSVQAYKVFDKEIEEGINYFRKRHPGSADDYVHEAIAECLRSLSKSRAAGMSA